MYNVPGRIERKRNYVANIISIRSMDSLDSTNGGGKYPVET
jgi:hypothetical protein